VTCNRALPLQVREPLVGPLCSLPRLRWVNAFAHDSTHQILSASSHRLDPSLLPITLAHLLLYGMAVRFVQGDEAWIKQELTAILVVKSLVHTGSLLRLMAVGVLPVLTLADGDAVWLMVLVGPATSEAILSLHLIDECNLVRTNHHGFLLRRRWNGRPIH